MLLNDFASLPFRVNEDKIYSALFFFSWPSFDDDAMSCRSQRRAHTSTVEEWDHVRVIIKLSFGKAH